MSVLSARKPPAGGGTVDYGTSQWTISANTTSRPPTTTPTTAGASQLSLSSQFSLRGPHIRTFVIPM